MAVIINQTFRHDRGYDLYLSNVSTDAGNSNLKLESNGGFVATVAIDELCNTIDVGTTLVPGGIEISTDARGVSRPQRNGIDIGAFELE